MAYQDAILRGDLHSVGISGTAIGRFFSGLSKGLSIARSHHVRQHQIDELNAKTDSELQGMGLERGNIVRHVYRDLFSD